MTAHERLIVKVSSLLVLLGKLLLILALVLHGPYTVFSWPLLIGLFFVLVFTMCYALLLWRCLRN